MLFSKKGFNKNIVFQKRFCSVPVDQVLKKFYRIVHPDLFRQQPQKSVNEKSFGDLMSYLDFVKSHRNTTEYNSTPFKLSFYTTTNPTTPVELEVFPPDDRATSKEKKFHLHKTLTSLFDKCNFDYDSFYVEDFGKAVVVERYAKKGDVTLLKYILSTNALFKELSKSEYRKQEETLQNYFLKMINELVSTYKIAKFEYSIKSHLFYNRCDRIKKRIEILENFRQTLNILKNEHNFTLKNLEDAVIIFGTYTRIDENGNLELDYTDTDSWITQIPLYTQAESKKVKDAAKSRAELQNQIVQKLEIASFYPERELVSDLEYRVFLTNIINEMNRKQWKPLTGLRKLNVKISKKIQYPESEDATATLVLPLRTHISDLREIINQSGEGILNNHAAINNKLSFAKKGLALESLSWSTHDVSTLQLKETLERLYKHGNFLKPYTSGLKLHIANDYGINEESRTISVRWDYLIDSPK